MATTFPSILTTDGFSVLWMIPILVSTAIPTREPILTFVDVASSILFG